MQRAVVLNETGELSATDFDLDPAVNGSQVPDGALSLRDARERAERRAIATAVQRSGGNLTAAARILEISRPTLYNLLRQHGFALPGETEAQS